MWKWGNALGNKVPLTGRRQWEETEAPGRRDVVYVVDRGHRGWLVSTCPPSFDSIYRDTVSPVEEKTHRALEKKVYLNLNSTWMLNVLKQCLDLVVMFCFSAQISKSRCFGDCHSNANTNRAKSKYCGKACNVGASCDMFEPPVDPYMTRKYNHSPPHVSHRRYKLSVSGRVFHPVSATWAAFCHS